MKHDLNKMLGMSMTWIHKFFKPQSAEACNQIAGVLLVIFALDKGRFPTSPEELDKYADQYFPNS